MPQIKGGYGDFQNTTPTKIAYNTDESVCLWYQKHPRSRSNSTLAPSTAREGLRLFCVNTYKQAASENRACRACTACERRMHMLTSAVAPAMVQAHRLGAGWGVEGSRPVCRGATGMQLALALVLGDGGGRLTAQCQATRKPRRGVLPPEPAVQSHAASCQSQKTSAS